MTPLDIILAIAAAGLCGLFAGSLAVIIVLVGAL